MNTHKQCGYNEQNNVFKAQQNIRGKETIVKLVQIRQKTVKYFLKS
jgi:hypothetical protein